MKNKPKICVPWKGTAFRAGAVLIFIGALLLLLIDVKSIARLYWTGSPYALNTLLTYIILMYAAVMFFFYEKYLPRMAAFMLLIGCWKLFYYTSYDEIVWLWIVPVIVLITAIGGRWNVSVRPFMRLKIPTPWLCALGALFTAIVFLIFFINTLLPELSDPSEDGYFLAEAFAIAAIIVGLFSLLFFTQPAPREAIADVSIARSVTSRGNACFVMASLVFLSDLVLMILGDRGLNAFGYGVWNAIQGLLPYILYIVVGLMVLAKRRSNILWLIFGLMFLIYDSYAFKGMYPRQLYLILLISAVGFVGNDPIFEKTGCKLTVPDCIALLVLLLALVVDVRDVVNGIRDALIMEPHRLYQYYRKQSLITVARTYHYVLRDIGLTLLILFSKLERCETTIIAIAVSFLQRVKNIQKEFQNNVGSRIRRLAYVLSSIFVIIMLVSLGAAAISFALFILPTISDVMYDWLPGKVPFVFTLYFLGGAFTFFLNAMWTWFIYAYGRASDDLRQGSYRLGFALGVPHMDGKAAEDDLPDF